MSINWHDGSPPNKPSDRRFLVIATSHNGTFDAAEDDRPDVFIVHFHDGEGRFVPARIRGMPEIDARPVLEILHWSELEFPVELRELTVRDRSG